jgi:polyisoprenoid-binding protein YceI
MPGKIRGWRREHGKTCVGAGRRPRVAHELRATHVSVGKRCVAIVSTISADDCGITAGMKFTHLALAVSLSLSAAACKNPADGKTAATVGEAKPETATPPATPPAAAPGTPAAAPAAAGTVKYAIAPDTSKLTLLGSKPTHTHTIQVHKFEGSVEVADGKPESAKVNVTIDMKSIEADDPKLTGHLQSPDFFDTAKFPTATFTSTEIKAGGDKGATHTITGNLEMRGVKKSISFPATVALAADKVSVKSEFVINRKDWNIVYPGMADDLIRDEVVVQLDLNAPVAK